MSGSDWSSHLPLVMLGLWTAPKDDSGFSSAEAVYGSNLSLPGKLIKHTKFPLEVFLRKIERTVSGFSGPPRHQVPPEKSPRRVRGRENPGSTLSARGPQGSSHLYRSRSKERCCGN